MPHRYPKRSQLKNTRKPYRVRNSPEYEMALRKRGELTLWFSEDAIEVWHAPASSKPGGQRIYSDLAIETALTIRCVYHLGLRQTEGFLRSVLVLVGLRIRIPDHSTLSRRSTQLDRLPVKTTGTNGPVHILFDSTGLRVHSGAQRQRQSPNRRAWRKLHLVVNLASGEILASASTSHQITDASRVADLLDQIDTELASLTADGAYDSRAVYNAIEKHRSDKSIPVIIPPRRNARLTGNSESGASQRDHNIRSMRKFGRRRWQKASGYTRRSLVETAISRYKTIVGRRLRSRTILSQRTEIAIACAVLNRMTQLGMPDGYCVA